MTQFTAHARLPSYKRQKLHICRSVRAIARALNEQVQKLLIISPQGHTDPAAYNERFDEAVDLLFAPDHYLYRMPHSQGVLLDQLGVRIRQGVPVYEPRAWRQFATGCADLYVDVIGAALKRRLRHRG